MGTGADLAKILVTGGAGYVGSHICKALRDAGHEPITFDNFSTGWRDAVLFGPVFEGDLRKLAEVVCAMEQHRPDAVFHIAALSDIAQSMQQQELYRAVNVEGTRNLLEAMQKSDVQKIVFSSTCAIFRAEVANPLAEDAVVEPSNTYGDTKLAAEKLISGYGENFGIESVLLRYFNVAGADGQAKIGEFHRPETHLIPRAILAAKENTAMVVNGKDYDTKDGTCIRDYIHVEDLAKAHLASLAWLLSNRHSDAFNLGVGKGHSVLEVLQAVAEVSEQEIRYSFADRREGDCAVLISDGSKARQLLGWVPQKSELRTMVQDAWNWHRHGGYVR